MNSPYAGGTSTVNSPYAGGATYPYKRCDGDIHRGWVDAALFTPRTVEQREALAGCAERMVSDEARWREETLLGIVGANAEAVRG